MKNNKTKIYIIALIILVVDQLVKLIIKSSLHLHQELVIINNFFSIHYLQNNGAAFSILQDKTILLIIIAVLYIAIMVYYIKKENFGKLNVEGGILTFEELGLDLLEYRDITVFKKNTSNIIDGKTKK